MVRIADCTADCAGVLGELHEQYTERQHYQRVPDRDYYDPDDLELYQGREEIHEGEKPVEGIKQNSCF